MKYMNKARVFRHNTDDPWMSEELDARIKETDARMRVLFDRVAETVGFRCEDIGYSIEESMMYVNVPIANIRHKTLGLWADYLNDLVDRFGPDTKINQIHMFQEEYNGPQGITIKLPISLEELEVIEFYESCSDIVRMEYENYVRVQRREEQIQRLRDQGYTVTKNA